MCLGGCTCPDPIPPPSEQFKNFRTILQVMALCLLIMMVFNFVILNIMGAIYTALLIYFLYLAWTQFNWCSVLFFFIFSLIQTITNMLAIISRIEHSHPFFGKDGMETFATVVMLIQFTFYGTAVFLSHHIYKHFKNRSGPGSQGLMGGLAPIVPGQGGQRNNMDDRMQRQQPQRQAQPQRGFHAFQGQGVAIG